MGSSTLRVRSQGGRLSPRAALRATGTRCSNQLPASPSPHEPRTHPTKLQPHDIRGDWGQSPSPSPRAREGERPREPRCGLQALDVPTNYPRHHHLTNHEPIRPNCSRMTFTATGDSRPPHLSEQGSFLLSPFALEKCLAIGKSTDDIKPCDAFLTSNRPTR